MTSAYSVLSEHDFADTTARYLTNEAGQVGLWLIPTSTLTAVVPRRATVAGESWVRERDRDRPGSVIEPLVRVRIIGDRYDRGFGQGRTLLWSPSNDRFRMTGHRREGATVITALEDETGLRLEHRLVQEPNGQALRSETRFQNASAESVRLELLTSFALSGITPFAADDAPGRLRVHRFRTVWSAEGRMVTDEIENLHLERSWAGGMNYSERFGQIGSMPVRGWFPTALIEDTVEGVVWGARLAVPTSWQLEVARSFDDVVFSGGLADREFGHWTKTVVPGETLEAPTAWLTCVAGSVDDACDRLVSVDVDAADALPDVEQDLPIIYNDWCTSWGEPRESDLLAIADTLRDLGVRYLVIDAGWYMPVAATANWATTLGDWQADEERFPDGLRGTAAAIRERGLIPGLWMEPEHVAIDSAAFHDTDHLLKRDGETLTVGVRRAWDLHDPAVIEYLDERVIGLLKDAGIGYLKLDYSETLGIGVDHPDGLGEGLRRHGLGTHALFDHIREAIPDVVIEICSAGGHRLESSLLQRSAMSSFSDAHELVEIPIIAAALHKLVLPRQSQIWAVLNPDDSRQRLDYSLASTFLGRMCLSGDIRDLDEEQLLRVRAATALYGQAYPVIKNGTSRLAGELGASWRHPVGWQALVRTSEDAALVVVHTFAEAPHEVSVAMPDGRWRLSATLTDPTVRLADAGMLTVEGLEEFDSQVILLHRDRLDAE